MLPCIALVLSINGRRERMVCADIFLCASSFCLSAFLAFWEVRPCSVVVCRTNVQFLYRTELLSCYRRCVEDVADD